ncbi:AlpA family phage regulatory protein [Photobacterium sp. DA100]|uniref:helix-turn-helix transcriptional regulator n=1 Tax=Photobacterium sp. DA100 TaxID=3027472 RepID=UPI00247A94AC|nr:AlpA family phage regulatory protein [Photobacterium sp. DA100]WEM42252.1 AlpA family phage regulatory protein [Photobacterium sp. DA100]
METRKFSSLALSPFSVPSIEQRIKVLRIAGEHERLVRDEERQRITTISRSRTWMLEREGRHPKRRKLGANSVAWLLSDLLWFIHNPSDDPIA